MSDQCRSVFIEVDYQQFGSARCSGLQFDNIIVVHGSVLYSLALLNCGIYDTNTNNIIKSLQLIISDLKKQQHFVNPEKCDEKETFRFRILRKSVSILNVDRSGFDNHTEDSSEDATFCLLCKPKYNKDSCLSDFLRLFTEDQHTAYNNSDDYLNFFLFLVSGVPNKYLFDKALHTLLSFVKGTPLHPGLPIAVESTPFANIAFHNSLSQGIICKTFGPDKEIFLIDARVTFSCEGAPIYVFDNGLKGEAIGIVFCMVESNNGEYSGFSMGISLKHVLMDVLGVMAGDYIPFEKLKPPTPSFLDVDLLSSAVIFVRCQHKWGSGVVVNAEMGLVLTCSHTLYHAQDSVHVVYKGKKYRAEVLFASPPSGPYDLALLSVGTIPGLRSLKLADTSPVVGEQVVTVGFALANETDVIDDGTPIISQGCVAKMSRSGGPLHTTCCTQLGMSGGAVLRPPDQLIGIVVCNVRFGNFVMPFFGIAVSVDDFRDAIARFIQTKNPACLQSLTVKSPELKMNWMLQNSKL